MPESRHYMAADTGGSCLKKSDSQLKVKKLHFCGFTFCFNNSFKHLILF